VVVVGSIVEDSGVEDSSVEDSGVEDSGSEDSVIEDSDAEADTVTVGADTVTVGSGTITVVTSLETVSVLMVVNKDPISTVPDPVTVDGSSCMTVIARELVCVSVECEKPMATDCVGAGE
jgi:hypothetical protein